MNFQDIFPVLKEYTYLNTANSGILYQPLAQWRTEHDQEFMDGGSNFRLKHATIIEDLRRKLTEIYNTSTSNVFLTPNFSFSFNTLLNGLDKNHRFLLLNEEYPSVAYPVTSSGFEYQLIDIDENLEENIIKAIDQFKPTAFAFSLVQYISGYKLSEDFIKKIKETYPQLLLLADGTQFCGTTNFNFSASGLDALISSGYKWLLGGYGNGFSLLSDQIKAEIYQDRLTKDLPTAPFLKGKDHLSMSFEPGHLDTLNFGSLYQSLNFLQSIGIDNIEKSNQLLSEKARSEFYKRGLLPEWMVSRDSQSNIVSLKLDEQTVQKLDMAKILCSARGAGTRFSFHFYNTLNDLEKLLDVLDGKD
ncbi:aminotransferase class V-fold PLP-dependent enzyme [Pedobacter chinensis]|uniref:Aminotransferase class V-fold PLP-dependent enzyme n=1 Tax=Pedobacter chinensis TaxID=2282421 RepID=A0A369Q4J3_9SPHI|nr:aminotransferase class V-fold PLP-dependent enzyme [Pedobacter chinensis]RDC58395.1 aminotransferase class V-fold PLP-dependent enzyme [Pedobacter chinensis]